MALAMKEDKSANPPDVGLLRPGTVMPQPEATPELVQQLERRV
jgi:hypothetical protein